MELKTARNIAIVLVIAAAVFLLPGGGKAATTFESILLIGFGVGFAYLGLRMYREYRVTLHGLGDRYRGDALRLARARRLPDRRLHADDQPLAHDLRRALVRAAAGRAVRPHERLPSLAQLLTSPSAEHAGSAVGPPRILD